MTHICLGGFSKMCRAPPKRPKTTHRTMADPSPLGRAHRARKEKHSPYPSGPSAPRISRRSLWNSLQRDDTTLSPRRRTSGHQQQMHTCRCGHPGKRAQSNTRAWHQSPCLQAKWASTQGLGGKQGMGRKRWACSVCSRDEGAGAGGRQGVPPSTASTQPHPLLPSYPTQL